MKPIRRVSLLATSSLALVAAAATPGLASSTPFSIRWTAPGDDSLTGRATAYDLRFSKSPITAANFLGATRITGLPAPATAGTSETFTVTGLPDGVLFYLVLKSGDERGNWSGISNAVTRPGQTTGVEAPAVTLSFSPPWPNPARQSVQWAYAMPQASGMQVDVLDVSGRHVRNLASGEREAGRGQLAWDLRDEAAQPVRPGVYLVRARLGTTEWTRRLVVTR